MRREDREHSWRVEEVKIVDSTAIEITWECERYGYVARGVEERELDRPKKIQLVSFVGSEP